MKTSDSWGSYYSIEIACIIFNISIAVCIDRGDNYLKRYNLFNNIKDCFFGGTPPGDGVLSIQNKYIKNFL